MVKVLWYCSQSAKSNKAWLVDDDKSKFVSNYNVYPWDSSIWTSISHPKDKKKSP
jgi:hypothetical protein